MTTLPNIQDQLKSSEEEFSILEILDLYYRAAAGRYIITEACSQAHTSSRHTQAHKSKQTHIQSVDTFVRSYHILRNKNVL